MIIEKARGLLPDTRLKVSSTVGGGFLLEPPRERRELAEEGGR
jgi:hypothetical protein